MMELTDQMGRSLRIDALPGRIVSVVPSQTELLHDLGAGETVVGITKFCIHPDSWHRTKPRVGGTKRLDLERIRALAPELIVANREENSRADLEILMQEFPVWITDIRTLADALDMIRSLGMLIGKTKEAEEMAGEIARRFRALGAPAAGRPAAYLIWRDPWMVAGGDTFIHEMLTLAGFRNIFADRPRYPVIDPAEVSGVLALLSSEPFPFAEKHAVELREKAPGCLPCLVDGEMCSWYGSRLLQAPAYLAGLARTLEGHDAAR